MPQAMNDHEGQGESRVALQNTSPNQSHEELLTKLYSFEKRVEILREKAHAVEEEKEKLLVALQKVQDNEDDIEFTEDEKEEVEALTERLICRCLTVEVAVSTPRTEEQEKALSRVNDLLKKLQDMSKLQDISETKRDHTLSLARSYLDACLAEPVGNAIDYRFQGIVLQCTVDDQKKIKYQLGSIIEKLGGQLVNT